MALSAPAVRKPRRGTPSRRAAARAPASPVAAHHGRPRWQSAGPLHPNAEPAPTPVSPLDLTLANVRINSADFNQLLAPVLEAAKQLEHSTITQDTASGAAWAIEQKLVTAAECRDALAHSTPKLSWLLTTRFAAAVTSMVEKHLGPIRSKHGQQWHLSDNLKSIHSEHYIAFDRSKVKRCSAATAKLFEKLMKHRRMHFATPQGLQGMRHPNGDVAYAIKDFDPKNPYESWKRYLQDEATEWEFHEGGDAPQDCEDPYAVAYDYAFGSYDDYVQTLTKLTAKPPRRKPLSASRDARAQQFLARSIALLDSIRGDRYFSLPDGCSHPSEALVVSPQPQAFDCAQMYFDSAAESGETPGVDLGTQPGAGKKPLHVALHAIASALILETLEELL